MRKDDRSGNHVFKAQKRSPEMASVTYMAHGDLLRESSRHDFAKRAGYAFY